MPPALTTLLAQIARGDVFHVIDTETTGHAPPAARVIEVACVSYVQGREVGRFETLIDPGVPIPPFITRLTGISPAMVAGQPPPHTAVERFAGYLAARPGHFVAHNAPFDERFLSWEFARWGQPWPFQARWCTVRLARRALPGLGRYNLDALIRHFGLPAGPRHRAMGDVEATGRAFWLMVAGLSGDPPAEGGPAAVVPPDPPPDSWGQLLARISTENRPFAALLAQQAKPVGPGPDGVLVIQLGERLLRWATEPRCAQLAILAREVYGPACAVRIEALPAVTGGPGSRG